MSSSTKRLVPGGVGRALAHAGVQHLAGVVAGGHQGVVAQDLGVAEGGTGLVGAGHLADGGVDIDDQSTLTGPGTDSPGSLQHLAHHRFELADMAEGERSQERAQRGGGHDPVVEHRLGGARAQHLGVVDVGAAGDDGVHQGQHLAPRQSAADSAHQANGDVDEVLDAEAGGQRGHQQQPGVGHQVLVVEGHRDAVDSARYSLHWKCLPGWRLGRLRTPSSSQLREAFPRTLSPSGRYRVGGSRLSGSRRSPTVDGPP
jgi:hypothetical protein